MVGGSTFRCNVLRTRKCPSAVRKLPVSRKPHIPRSDRKIASDYRPRISGDEKPDICTYSVENNQRSIRYWCKWDHDGPNQVDDWEPMFVEIDRRGRITRIRTRAHWTWVIWEKPELKDSNVQVDFVSGYHTPIIKSRSFKVTGSPEDQAIGRATLWLAQNYRALTRPRKYTDVQFQKGGPPPGSEALKGVESN